MAQVTTPSGRDPHRERIIFDTAEWYRRLEDVSGRSNPRGRDDVVAGYDALDRARLDTLRDRYHLSYAVVSKGHEPALGYAVVYSNRGFAVLDVR